MQTNVQKFRQKVFWLMMCGGFIVLSSTVNAAPLMAIPARVTNAFKARYPTAKNVEWNNKIGSCQANFQVSGTRFEAKFNKKGEWESTEKAEKEYMMPETVKDGFEKSRYRDWKIRSSYVHYSPKEGTKYHIVARKGFLKKKHLVFNEDGQLLHDRMAI